MSNPKGIININIELTGNQVRCLRRVMHDLWTEPCTPEDEAKKLVREIFQQVEFLKYKSVKIPQKERGTKVKLTEEQKESIKVLKERWDHVSEPRKLPCDDAVLVEVKSDETGVGMFIGIETDGHRHS